MGIAQLTEIKTLAPVFDDAAKRRAEITDLDVNSLYAGPPIALTKGTYTATASDRPNVYYIDEASYFLPRSTRKKRRLAAQKKRAILRNNLSHNWGR